MFHDLNKRKINMQNKNIKRKTIKSLISFTAIFCLAFSLSSCASTVEGEWKNVAKQPIISLQDKDGVYVTGLYSSSEMVLDYKFAYKTPDGGIKQKLVSKLISDEVPLSYSNISVTIYEDIKNNEESYIEIYSCNKIVNKEDIKEDSETFTLLPNFRELNENIVYVQCLDPSSEDKESFIRARASIHIPVGGYSESTGMSNLSDFDN